MYSLVVGILPLSHIPTLRDWGIDAWETLLNCTRSSIEFPPQSSGLALSNVQDLNLLLAHPQRSHAVSHTNAHKRPLHQRNGSWWLPPGSLSSKRVWKWNSNLCIGKDLTFMFVLPKARTMSGKMETPSRPVSYISTKLLNGLSDKKEASCSHRKSTSPSVRSSGYFKRFSALISWGLSTGWPLSFVTFAVTSWESLLGEWHVPGGLVGRNEPPVDVPFALPSSICW